jgi:hypothetical protein
VKASPDESSVGLLPVGESGVANGSYIEDGQASVESANQIVPGGIQSVFRLHL